METMQPVVVKIGEDDVVTSQNPNSLGVIFQVGNLASRDAGSHASVLVSVNQVVVSIWDGTQMRGILIDRFTGTVTTQ